jgi:hypothetical protein
MKLFFGYDSLAAKGYMVDLDSIETKTSDSVWVPILLVILALSPLLIFIPWDKLF